jgi:hypothetical protein
MATGRKTVVVGQVIDPVTWGNPLWDQSVQTFASAADRTAQFPAPKQGAVTWLEDVKRLEVHNGTTWVGVSTTATDVPWTKLASGFNSNWSGVVGSGWDGLWYCVRSGIVTVTGAVTKSAGLPIAGEIIIGLPPSIRPAKQVAGTANTDSLAPIVDPVNGWLMTSGTGPATFSLSVVYPLST